MNVTKLQMNLVDVASLTYKSRLYNKHGCSSHLEVKPTMVVNKISCHFIIANLRFFYSGKYFFPTESD